jgi:signal transduction histidine kinase
MSEFRCRKLFRLLPILVFILCTCWQAQGQDDYDVAHYTSKQGLPQNSVRGLVFDGHGFLWIATDGGIARFNGQSFRLFNDSDHPGLNNQRFTHALMCNDSTIVFFDQLMGLFSLVRDRFTTVQLADIRNRDTPPIIGGPPTATFVIRDTFFLEELQRVRNRQRTAISIFAVDSNKVYIVSDRVVLINKQSHERKIILTSISTKDKFAFLDGRLIWINEQNQLFRLQPATNSFETCSLTDEKGNPFTGSFVEASIFSLYPFKEIWLINGQKLFRISSTEERKRFTISAVLNALPDNCVINAIAYRPADDMLVIGTDSKGLYTYHHRPIHTFLYDDPQHKIPDNYYAQCLMDSTTLMASNGLFIDIDKIKVSGHFAQNINPNILCDDGQGFFYTSQGRNIIRYNVRTKQVQKIVNADQFATQCITRIDSTIWIGTTGGVGYIKDDSLRWMIKTPFRTEKSGIKCIAIDADSNLWFGAYDQLARFSIKTHHLDTFAFMNDADCRALAMIRGNLFIGTYGKGYYIYHEGRFIHMPAGRNHELSNTHAFIEDANGYLWMTTNRGLYKTQLDAIDAFLKDTTQQLDYYAYLEEDGIKNTEFNGGCSPSYIWLPDGKLSLPTLEGLVMFRPREVPHYFSKDSMLIEYLEADHVQYQQEQNIIIPASHTNITIHFAGAWWNQPYNQYISYKLEGLHHQFQVCDIGQSSYTIGHLKPGYYTFLIRRRSGFGPNDYMYSRLHFTVEPPWYAKSWAFLLYGIGFVMAIWLTSILYSRSIKRRNVELQKKVDEQTTALLNSNEQLEQNLSQLSRSEIILRENIRVRDRLISIITHDILTPLRFIGKIATLGAEDKPSDQNLPKRALTDVQNAIQKLFHSTQNLLHWVTYQQEQFKISSANCSPFALVEQLFDDFREMSRFQENMLVNEVPEDDVILTDPRILNIVLHNLLSNAIKYTQHGQVRVRSLVEHNWYILEVSDTGRGMSALQLESARRGHAHEDAAAVNDFSAGNGIGLSLVAELVQALGGRWEIDSPAGSGVLVRIFLTLA